MLTNEQIELIRRLVRRIDHKLDFEAHPLPDGAIEIKLSQGRHKSQTRITPEALAATAEDAIQFETLRQQLKRVSDRMWIPAPPKKAPKAEIQSDLLMPMRGGGPPRGGRR
jgi:hypothetical protein